MIYLAETYKLDASVIEDSNPCRSKVGTKQEVLSLKFRAQVWQWGFRPNFLAYNNIHIPHKSISSLSSSVTRHEPTIPKFKAIK